MVQRYQIQRGDRQAGTFTYFAFLSFFPLIALAFALFGYVVTFRPDALTELKTAIESQLPGLADKIDLDQIAEARQNAGIIGLLGLLYAGLGAVDALRVSLQEMWMTAPPRLSWILVKLRDLVALILLGITLFASALISGFAVQATDTIVGWLGVSQGPLTSVSVAVAGLLAGLLADVVLFLIILGWLAKPEMRFRLILRGALVGAIGFGVLKQFATLLLAHSTNPLYGAFTVTVGLLLWINLSGRLILYTAAWVATSRGYPPPEPTPAPTIDGYETAVENYSLRRRRRLRP
ncbi:YihY/virulence factor BrkB family protein [Streptosporangiaceae bacterium NEAU-GS5]|nr:YihY/virulence factor BrkB family protein [Streptosporangiaceae bacterium NEAU-GS5]